MIGYREFLKIPCPKCGRRGLHYAPHPHAFGWHDYGKAQCRICMAWFPIEEIEKLREEIK